MTTLYDPLTWDNLIAGLTARFEQRPRQPLATIADADVEGPGVYALFYSGRFPAYQAVADGMRPIYIGKAVPPGSRKAPARMRKAQRCVAGCGNMPDPLRRRRTSAFLTLRASTWR